MIPPYLKVPSFTTYQKHPKELCAAWMCAVLPGRSAILLISSTTPHQVCHVKDVPPDMSYGVKAGGGEDRPMFSIEVRNVVLTNHHHIFTVSLTEYSDVRQLTVERFPHCSYKVYIDPSRITIKHSLLHSRIPQRSVFWLWKAFRDGKLHKLQSLWEMGGGMRFFPPLGCGGIYGSYVQPTYNAPSLSHPKTFFLISNIFRSVWAPWCTCCRYSNPRKTHSLIDYFQVTVPSGQPMCTQVSRLREGPCNRGFYSYLSSNALAQWYHGARSCIRPSLPFEL